MNNLMAKVIASIVFIKFIKIYLLYIMQCTHFVYDVYDAYDVYYTLYSMHSMHCIALHTIYAMYMKVIVVVLPKFRGYSEYYFLHHWPNNGNNGKANFHFFLPVSYQEKFYCWSSLSLQQAFSSYQRYPRRKKIIKYKSLFAIIWRLFKDRNSNKSKFINK